MKILFNVLILLSLIALQTSHAQGLSLESGSDVTLSNGSGYFLIGLENSFNIVLDNNEIQGRNNGSASQLILNNDGGSVVMGGYTRLGVGAPHIKTKLVQGTTASTTNLLPHGLPDQSKIVSASIIVEADLSGNLYHEHYTVNWHDQANVAATTTIPNGSKYKLYLTYIQ